MAGIYGWDLRHIFEYVTLYDAMRLNELAQKRRERDKLADFRTLANVIHVASFHEKDASKGMDSLLKQLTPRDESYLYKKFDRTGLDALKAKVMANRSMSNAN